MFILQKKCVNLDSGLYQEIKYVNDASLVDHLSSVKNITNAQTVVPDLPVGAKLHQFWRKWAALGISPKILAVIGESSVSSRRRKLHSPLPVLAKLNQVPYHHKLLCKSLQEPLPVGGIASSAFEQKCSRVGQKSRI